MRLCATTWPAATRPVDTHPPWVSYDTASDAGAETKGDTGVCEKNIPLEKRKGGKASFEHTTQSAIKGVFAHRHHCSRQQPIRPQGECDMHR